MNSYDISVLLLIFSAFFSFLLLITAVISLRAKMKRYNEEKKKLETNGSEYTSWKILENVHEERINIIKRNSVVRNNLDHVVNDAKEALSGRGGKLYLQSSEGVINLISFKDIKPTSLIKIGEPLRIGKGEEGEGMAGVVMETKKPLIVQEYAKWPGHIKKVADLFSSVIEVPVFKEGQAIGVLSVFADSENRVFTERDVPKLAHFAEKITNILVRAEIDQSRINLNKEVKLLQSSVENIWQASNWEDTKSRILDTLKDVIPYNTATLQKIRGNGRQIMAYKNLKKDDLSDDLLKPISKDAIVSHIVAEKEPLVIPFTSEHPDWTVYPTTKFVQSWIGLPLVFQTTVIALITLDHKTPGYYEGARIDLLKLFGKYAAVELQNSERVRNQEEIEKVAKQLESKEGSAYLKEVTKQIAECLDCPRCILFLPKNRGDGEVSLDPVQAYYISGISGDHQEIYNNDGIIGRVFNSGISELLYDATEDKDYLPPSTGRYLDRAMLVVPIMDNGIPVGVVSADHYMEGWFSKDDKVLVEAIVRNINFNHTQTSSVTLEQILSLGNTIFNSKDLNAILKTVAKGAVEIISGGHTSAIYITDKNLAKRFETDKFYYPEKLDVPAPRMQEGVTKKSFLQKKEIIISDTSKDPLANPGLQEKGIISIVCVPLLNNNHPLGAIFVHVYGDEPYHFLKDEVTVLKILALQVTHKIKSKTGIGIREENFKTVMASTYEEVESVGLTSLNSMYLN